MSTVISIIAALLIFSIIIMVHELGHFVAAKKCDVKVNEFAIGMGPAIFKKKKGETTYAVRLFPIGGYCMMEGEDETSSDERAFSKKKVSRRLIITLAGATMNLVLGFVAMLIVCCISDGLSSNTISKFYDNAATEQSGLMIGDEILSVNGVRTFVDSDIVYQFQIAKENSFDMVVEREGKKVELNDVKLSSYTDKDGKDSIYVDFYVKPIKKNPLTVLEYSFKKTVSVGRMIWMTLIDMLTGHVRINDLSGPVGIVDTIGTVIQSSGVDILKTVENILTLVVFISVNVGIFNLLPFPALDGARAVFLIIEAIRRKPIKREYEGMVHFIGLAILMILMVVVSFNDISKIFNR